MEHTQVQWILAESAHRWATVGRWMQRSTQFTVHSAQCALHSVQCSAQCTVHSAHCIVHSAQCTVHSAHYTVHSASCTVRSAVHTGGRWAPAELLPVLSYCLHLALLLLLCSLLHFAGTAFLWDKCLKCIDSDLLSLAQLRTSSKSSQKYEPYCLVKHDVQPIMCHHVLLSNLLLWFPNWNTGYSNSQAQFRQCSDKDTGGSLKNMLMYTGLNTLCKCI